VAAMAIEGTGPSGLVITMGAIAGTSGHLNTSSALPRGRRDGVGHARQHLLESVSSTSRTSSSQISTRRRT
jgi:hypothetical protein